MCQALGSDGAHWLRQSTVTSQTPCRTSRNKDRRNVTARLSWWRERIGDVALINIDPPLVSEYRDKLARRKNRANEPISGATINRHMTALSVVLTTAAKEWQWLESNPVLRVKRRSEGKPRVRFLSDDERERLLAACRADSNPDIHGYVLCWH
jgi:integrase